MVTRRDLGKGIAGAAIMAGAPRQAMAQAGEPATSAGISNLPVLHVPARDIPSPAYLNEVDRVRITQFPPKAPYPPIENKDAWRAIAAAGQMHVAALAKEFAVKARIASVEVIDAGGAKVFDIEPTEKLAPIDTIILDIHGGALIFGSGEACADLGRDTAARFGVRVWSVDYRMPPDHPYPAGLEDCVAAYRHLLKSHKPQKIVVHSASAGGNLAAAMLLRARAEGLPMPSGGVFISPEIDLTEGGDSFRTNSGIDPLGSLMGINLLYADGRDLSDPLISPLFNDFHGFPPTILTAGTRDMFLSNSARMHAKLRAAGVYAELHVQDAVPHQGYNKGSLEEQALTRELRRFVLTALTPVARRTHALELEPSV